MTERAVAAFTIGLGGYAWRYRPMLESQAAWAKKHGYVWGALTRIQPAPSPETSAWLKLVICQKLLRAGYRTVIYLDADCEVSRTAPSLTDELEKSKAYYLGLGVSGRVNSGVMMLDAAVPGVAEKAIADILADAGTPPRIDAPTAWENTYVIQRLTGDPMLKLLDRRWNNSFDLTSEAYVRHFTSGLKLAWKPSRRDALRATLARARSSLGADRARDQDLRLRLRRAEAAVAPWLELTFPLTLSLAPSSLEVS